MKRFGKLLYDEEIEHWRFGLNFWTGRLLSHTTTLLANCSMFLSHTSGENAEYMAK